jgi:hypothetical protein
LTMASSFIRPWQRGHTSTSAAEVAIEEGATIVRVGTAIFGERTPRV